MFNYTMDLEGILRFLFIGFVFMICIAFGEQLQKHFEGEDKKNEFMLYFIRGLLLEVFLIVITNM